MNYEELIDDLENGELGKYLKYFDGDYDAFFSFLKKRNLFSHLSLKGIDSDDWQNSYLLWLSENDKDKYHYWLSEFLNGFVFENGKPFLIVDDMEELSILFCDRYRDDLSQKTIASILSGDLDFDRYLSTTDNVYRDVIEELDGKNTNRLYEYILDSLKDTTIEPETDLLKDISVQQNSNLVKITKENIKSIVDDEESINYLLEDYLEDLKYDLSRIYDDSYNNAYESMLYKSVWNELSTYFKDKGTWLERPHQYKKDTTIHYLKLEVNSNVLDIIKNYLEDYKDHGQSGTIEYEGNIISIINQMENCLGVRISDYPDSREIDENINSYFSDYI